MYYSNAGRAIQHWSDDAGGQACGVVSALTRFRFTHKPGLASTGHARQPRHHLRPLLRPAAL